MGVVVVLRAGCRPLVLLLRLRMWQLLNNRSRRRRRLVLALLLLQVCCVSVEAGVRHGCVHMYLFTQLGKTVMCSVTVCGDNTGVCCEEMLCLTSDCCACCVLQLRCQFLCAVQQQQVQEVATC